jgi:hypothetical protein
LFREMSIGKTKILMATQGRILSKQTVLNLSTMLNTIVKCKAVPLQVWSGPEGPRKLRFPDFWANAQDGGKFVSLTHRPHLPPGNNPGTQFC